MRAPRAGRVSGLRSGLLLTALLFSFLATAQAASLNTWRDDLGQPWHVPPQLPQRWVVLGPHLVDMALQLGLGGRIVGVQDDRDFAGAHATSLSGYPVVGAAGQVSEERLRRLRPDLVVFWPTGMTVAQQTRLRRLGIALLAIEPRHLDDIPERLRWLAALGGADARGEALAAQWRARLDGARRQPEAPRLRGFYQVWPRPLYTLAPDHLVSEAMRVCGVDSIVPDTGVAAPVLSVEAVVAAAPDVILTGPEQIAEARRFWGRFQGVPAVRDGAILVVPDRELTRPGLSLLDALPRLCAQLRPWRMRHKLPSSR